MFDCGIFEFLPGTGYHSFFRHTSVNGNDTELRKMNVEHCSFLHHTSMKRKMTSIFEKLLRGKKLYFLNVGKKKEIGKTAENNEVTEHDCHQRGNLSTKGINCKK